MIKVKGYAAHSASEPLKPFDFERKELEAHDVQIEVLFCGMCHSDVHSARNEWKHTYYPIVPGHELVGKVTAVGQHVKDHNIDDIVGVGPMVGCCEKCEYCKNNMEQYCAEEFTEIFNSIDKDGNVTRGGYSSMVIINEKFVFQIPKKLLDYNLAQIAPLFCAGLTCYSALKHWKVGPKSNIGIIGIGGLGHLAVKLAKAMGATVTVFTSTPWKQKDVKRLGADIVLSSFDEASFKSYESSFDFILSLLPAPYMLDPFIKMIKVDGTLCIIGIPNISHLPFKVDELVFGRRHIAASVLGSPQEMRELLDFCAEHGIVADVEVIKPEDINNGFERMLQRDVKYRFVIDMSALT